MTEDGIYPFSSTAFEAAFYLSVLGWVLYLLVQSLEWSADNRLFPVASIGILSALLVLQLVKLLSPTVGGLPGIPAAERGETESKRGEKSKIEREKTELLMVGWTIILPVSLYYFGFVYTIPAYLFLFLAFFTRNVTKSALLTLTVSMLMYFLFVDFLNVRLWDGVVFTIYTVLA